MHTLIVVLTLCFKATVMRPVIGERLHPPIAHLTTTASSPSHTNPPPLSRAAAPAARGSISQTLSRDMTSTALACCPAGSSGRSALCAVALGPPAPTVALLWVLRRLRMRPTCGKRCWERAAERVNCVTLVQKCGGVQAMARVRPAEKESMGAWQAR
eukprot:346788-Chlamydomonas_euryale.AAC.2